MGLNTTILIRNDDLHRIEKNPAVFVQKLAAAIQANDTEEEFFSGARLINMGHADYTTLLAVGGNAASRITSLMGGHFLEEDKLKLLKAFAAEMGYTIRRKNK